MGDGTSTSYNSLHEPTVVTDTQGYTTSTQYNAVGDPLVVTDPLRNTTLYTYTASGLRTALTDGNHHTTQYGYDAFGDTVAVTDALGRVSTLTYDTNISRLSSTTDPKRQTTTVSYDAEDRALQSTYQDGSTVKNYIDADGNVTKTVDSSGTTLYLYDGDNRLMQQTYPDGTVVSYTYDAAGRLKTKSEPGMPLTTYTYDAGGRLQRIDNSLWGPINYTYDAASRLTALGYPNGITTTYTEDADNRLTNLTEAKGSAILLSDGFTFDKPGGGTWGLRSTETHNDNGTTYTWSYGYDADARLISATLTSPYNKSYTYGYDAVGNMTNNQGTVLSYDAANQLTASYGYTYTFDANGNETSAWGSSRGQWAYDAQNHTQSVTSPGVITTTYQTNGGGQRAQKTIVYSGTTTSGTFDAEAMGLGMYRQTAPVSTTTYYERDPSGRLLALTNGTTVYYYGLDGHGSVTTVTDGAGALKNFYTYDPYGNKLYKVETAALANPWQYASGFQDAESGNYLLGVRYYSPALGRFLQQDPLGSGGESQYAYAGSDPCNNSDPSGMKTCYHYVSSSQMPGQLDQLNGGEDYWSNQATADEQMTQLPVIGDVLEPIFGPQSTVEESIADNIDSAWKFLDANRDTGAYIGYYGVGRSDSCVNGDSTSHRSGIPVALPDSNEASGYWQVFDTGQGQGMP